MGRSPAPPWQQPSQKSPGAGAGHGTGIPKGDGLLPGAGTKDLQRMHEEMSGRKEVRKEALIVAAATRGVTNWA